MQAVIFGLMMPVIPLLVRKLYKKDERLTLAQMGARYVIYTLLATLMTSVVMVAVSEEGTSFLWKVDMSPVFALKYTFLEAAAVALIAVAEWAHDAGRVKVTVEWEKYRNSPVGWICRRIVFPFSLFALAAWVAYLNFGLIYDNVVWGDEAYTCNAIRHEMDGIFQILTQQENHPPLHFLWLKAFAELFGYEIPVYHFASYVPFVVGLLLAVTLLRKRYGNIPAAFFVVIAGLSAPCLEYNMEIRMYALAFLGLGGCYYCVSRILSGSRALGWIGMVFWALVAAYSHYYALVAAGIMVAAACVAAWLRYRGRTWVKGLVSIAVFAGLYAPWLSQVFRATRSVSVYWWMTEIESLGTSLDMIGCGAGMSRIILGLLLLLTVALLLPESSIFRVERKGDAYLVNVTTPSTEKWSEETYVFAVGLATIIGTLIFAYGISIVMRPLVTGRYLYPLCAVTAIMLAVGCKRMFAILKALEERFRKGWFLGLTKCILVLLLCVLTVRGLGNYKAFKATVEEENTRTEEVLYYIGEVDENTQLVTNGVQHLGWTVLDYYFPEAEVVNGTYTDATADDVWYFTPGFLREDQFQSLEDMGYHVTANYGECQLSKYQFVLYRFVKKQPENLD